MNKIIKKEFINEYFGLIKGSRELKNKCIRLKNYNYCNKIMTRTYVTWLNQLFNFVNIYASLIDTVNNLIDTVNNQVAI